MDKELINIITQYHQIVSELFLRVTSHLDISFPITNVEWPGPGVEQVGETEDGIEYFIHGYGIAMNDGVYKVDFDLGDEGQIDGIDPWKLFDFIRRNNINSTFIDAKSIEIALKEALAQNQVTFSGYTMYYLSNE